MTREPVQVVMALCRLLNFSPSSRTLLSNAGSLLLQHGCHGSCCPATVGNQGPAEPTQTDGDKCKATSFSERHFTLYILAPDTHQHTARRARPLNIFPLKTQTAPSVMSLLSWKPPDGDCRYVFFHNTPETSSFLSSDFPHFSSADVSSVLPAD